jgi:hypothetical protein
MYASDHDGAFPGHWSDCIPYIGTNSLAVLECPAKAHGRLTSSNVDVSSDYMLVPGRTERDHPDSVLAYEPLGNHGGQGGHVLFVNGAVKWCTQNEYATLNTH